MYISETDDLVVEKTRRGKQMKGNPYRDNPNHPDALNSRT